MTRFSTAALFGALLALGGCDDTPATPATEAAQPVSARADVVQGAGFDFYVLALSWSPSYCAAEGPDANRQQCSSQRPYAFVVHGLWPQYERGYPENCRVPERDVPRDRAAELRDIMPSTGLVRQQWRKHGSCAGLSQDDYFDVVRAARNRVAIPDAFRAQDQHRSVSPQAVEQAFLDSNPGLPANGIAVSCDNRYLREVRICMSKTLEFRACPEVDRKACRARSVAMPPVRGR